MRLRARRIGLGLGRVEGAVWQPACGDKVRVRVRVGVGVRVGVRVRC